LRPHEYVSPVPVQQHAILPEAIPSAARSDDQGRLHPFGGLMAGVICREVAQRHHHLLSGARSKLAGDPSAETLGDLHTRIVLQLDEDARSSRVSAPRHTFRSWR
jgi:hypothetical protein